MKSDPNHERQQPQFISKLVKLMEEFPDTIDYGEDGKELVIYDKKNFIDVVLQKYFRHGNWRSFIRQLNMYNFRKINRGNDREIFVNPLFYRGNEINFHQIRRKMNIREEEEQYEKDLQGRVEYLLDRNFGRESSLCTFMGDVFSFKGETDQTISSIKKGIEGLGSKKKTKDTKPMVQEMKESFQMIEEASQKFTHTLQIFSKVPDQNSHINSFKNLNQNYILGSFKPEASLKSQFGLVETKEFLELSKEEKQNSIKEEDRIKRSRMMLGISNQSSFSSLTKLIS